MEPVLKQFRAFLHQRSLRATDVRKAIVRAILAHKGHFDIEALVRDLRAKGVDASRATGLPIPAPAARSWHHPFDGAAGRAPHLRIGGLATITTIT